MARWYYWRAIAQPITADGERAKLAAMTSESAGVLIEPARDRIARDGGQDLVVARPHVCRLNR